MQEQFDSVVHNDHVEGEAEHVFWLDDAEKWRADHRRLLDMLMQVQAVVLYDHAVVKRVKVVGQFGEKIKLMGNDHISDIQSFEYFDEPLFGGIIQTGTGFI